jgi:hypothetical protein
MLELETLSPLTILEPGEHIDYIEDWYLLDNIEVPQHEDDVVRSILPAIERIT